MNGYAFEKMLEELSGIVIGVLKEHRAIGRPVTSTSLFSSLKKERGFVDRWKTLFREDATGPEAGDGSGREDGREDHALAPGLQDLRAQVVGRVREAYESILDEEDDVIGQASLKRLLEHQEKVLECDDLESILPLMGQIFDVFQDYIVQMGGERRRIARFLAALEKHLSALDQQIHGILSVFVQEESSPGCTEGMDEKLVEIRNSVRLGQSLEELKQQLQEQLQEFQFLIENRKYEDAERLKDISQKMVQLRDRFLSMKSTFVELQKQTRIIPQLEKQALLDELTGLPNRRGYEQVVREEWARHRSHGAPFSLIVLDLDHFKHVNDTYGHSMGDVCLREMAKRLSQSLRESDVLARYGGEEFVAVLPLTTKDGASVVAERMRVLAEKTRFQYGDAFFRITVSLGVAQVESGDQSPEDIFNRADRALYEAKANGRNRVKVS